MRFSNLLCVLMPAMAACANAPRVVSQYDPARSIRRSEVRLLDDQPLRPRPSATRTPESSGHVALLPPLTTRRVWAGADVNDIGSPSPDGRLLSHLDNATGDLAVRTIATGAERRITNNQVPWMNFALHSIFSPDGKRLAYWWMDTEANKGEKVISSLRVVGLDSSPPRAIYEADDIDQIEPHDWTRDGRYILAVITRTDRTNQLALAPVSGGALRVLKTFNDWRRPSAARVSPDGRYIAYDFPPILDSPRRDVYLLDLETGREIAVVKQPGDDYLAGWTGAGRLLFATDRRGTPALMSLTVADGKPRGEPELIRSELWRMRPMRVLDDGTVFYSISTGSRDLFTASYDFAAGKLASTPVGITKRPGEGHRRPAWSPDGRFIAYLTNTETPVRVGTTVITIQSVRTGEAKQIVPKVGYINGLTWTPDGKALAFPSVDLKSRPGIFRLDLATGEATPIVMRELIPSAPVFTPDGRWMLYSGASIIARDLGSGTERAIFQPEGGGTVYGFFKGAAPSLAVSPDGKWLLFAVSDSARAQSATKLETIRVMPTSGGPSRVVARFEYQDTKKNAPTPLWPTNVFAWTPDSRSVVYGTGSANLGAPSAALWRVSVDGGAPQRLDPPAANYETLQISPDGKRILYKAGDLGTEIWMLESGSRGTTRGNP